MLAIKKFLLKHLEKQKRLVLIFLDYYIIVYAIVFYTKIIVFIIVVAFLLISLRIEVNRKVV